MTSLNQQVILSCTNGTPVEVVKRMVALINAKIKFTLMICMAMIIVVSVSYGKNYFTVLHHHRQP